MAVGISHSLHDCEIYNGNSFLLDNRWLATNDYITTEQHEYFKFKRSDIKIKVSENLIFVLPYDYVELGNHILAAKYILELENDWDGEGGKPYSEKTLKQAINFVIEYTQWVFDTLNFVIAPPKILHGPNQSIDLLWETQSYELLINISPHPKKIVRFYGDDKRDTRIEGQFNINDPHQSVFLFLLTNERKVS